MAEDVPRGEFNADQPFGDENFKPEVPPVHEQLGLIMSEAGERIHNEQLVLREAELTVDLTNDPALEHYRTLRVLSVSLEFLKAML